MDLEGAETYDSSWRTKEFDDNIKINLCRIGGESVFRIQLALVRECYVTVWRC
jgi:hypothetical protein